MGLALSDAAWLTAQPLTTLERTNRRNDLRHLRELVRRHNVRHIVLGHPLHLDGTRGEMAVETERFAARTEKELGVPVELVDERLSSWEAERMLPPSAAARDRKGAVDRLAAAVILRDYLERGQTRRRTPPNAERAHGGAQEHVSRRRRKQVKV